MGADRMKQASNETNSHNLCFEWTNLILLLYANFVQYEHISYLSFAHCPTKCQWIWNFHLSIDIGRCERANTIFDLHHIYDKNPHLHTHKIIRQHWMGDHQDIYLWRQLSLLQCFRRFKCTHSFDFTFAARSHQFISRLSGRENF